MGHLFSENDLAGCLDKNQFKPTNCYAFSTFALKSCNMFM